MLAKAIADIIVKDPNGFIRIDMSEYVVEFVHFFVLFVLKTFKMKFNRQNQFTDLFVCLFVVRYSQKHEVSKFIGAPPG
jgi:phosphomevalonate kinase